MKQQVNPRPLREIAQIFRDKILWLYYSWNEAGPPDTPSTPCFNISFAVHSASVSSHGLELLANTRSAERGRI
jgi:hypothetical protein